MATSQIQGINTKELEEIGFNSDQIDVIQWLCKTLRYDMKALCFHSISMYVTTVLENPEEIIGDFKWLSKQFRGNEEEAQESE